MELMSYRELREILNNEMNESELDQIVTVYLTAEDEFVSVSSTSMLISDSSEDRLDPGSVYFSV